MRNKESAMAKLCAPLTFALVCLFVLSACDNFFNPVNNHSPTKTGYGRVSISFVDEITSPTTSQRARTVWPDKIFDSTAYTFTKTTDGTTTTVQDDSNTEFTLEVGSYTVKVDAYMEDSTGLDVIVASGTSSFSIVSGTTTGVEVRLSIVTIVTGLTEDGKFAYTIKLPAGASAAVVDKVTLEKWGGGTITLPAPDTTTANTATLSPYTVAAGVYLLTVEASDSGSYAGTFEVVYIEPLLTTTYKHEFVTDDFKPPAVARIVSGGVLGEYATLQDAIDNADDTGTTTVTSPTEIVILQDITAAGGYSIPADTNIKLTVKPGEDLTIKAAAGGFTLFTVDKANSSLTLGSVTGNTGSLTLNGQKATVAEDRGGVHINNSSARFTMNIGVTITGFYNGTYILGSGGVFVEKGTFTMEGGAITDNNAEFGAGGGVYVESGTFTMNEGTISGNTAFLIGGGVYVDLTGEFTMSGGTISENITDEGGGVCVDGQFTMSGGEISGNSANHGGGVYVDGQFTMNGGTIYGTNETANPSLQNNASGNGDAVYVSLGTANYNGAYGDDMFVVGDQIATTNDTVPRPALFAARIGTQGYSTLAEAITNATGGNAANPVEILLLMDITAGVTNEPSVGNGYNIANEHILLTPVGNRTITAAAGGFELFTVSDGSLTLGSATSNTGKLTLSGGTGGTMSDRQGVYVWSGASFAMNKNVTITGFKNSIEGGGVYVSGAGSEFIMNGGAITGNSASKGGGVFVWSGGVFTMNGGTISGNTASGNGGGVCVDVNGPNIGTFTMKGGEISGNTATQQGGGVYVTGAGSTFTMEGGIIYGTDKPSLANTATDGAAVYVDSGTAEYGSGAPIATPPGGVDITVTGIP